MRAPYVLRKRCNLAHELNITKVTLEKRVVQALYMLIIAGAIWTVRTELLFIGIYHRVKLLLFPYNVKRGPLFIKTGLAELLASRVVYCVTVFVTLSFSDHLARLIRLLSTSQSSVSCLSNLTARQEVGLHLVSSIMHSICLLL